MAQVPLPTSTEQSVAMATMSIAKKNIDWQKKHRSPSREAISPSNPNAWIKLNTQKLSIIQIMYLLQDSIPRISG